MAGSERRMEKMSRSQQFLLPHVIALFSADGFQNTPNCGYFLLLSFVIT